MATASRSRGPCNSAWASRGAPARSFLPCWYRSARLFNAAAMAKIRERKPRSGASPRGQTGPPTIHASSRQKYSFDPRTDNRPGASRAEFGRQSPGGRNPSPGQKSRWTTPAISIALKPISRTTSRQRGQVSPIAAQCPIGRTRGWMAGSPQAPVLVLAAPDACAPSIAMAVRTAAAQRERRTNRRR